MRLYVIRYGETNSNVLDIYNGSLLDEDINNNGINQPIEVRIDNLETIPELFKRVHSFLDEIKEKYKNKNIRLVTHGGVARVIYFYFNELPKDSQIEQYIPNNCEIKEYTY